MNRSEKLILRARYEEIEVDLSDFLDPREVTVSILSGEIPQWLNEELAIKGVQIYQEQGSAWFLAPLGE